MHESSLASCATFIHDHLLPREDEPLLIADVGSLDVNGTYRPLFVGHPNWTYVGLDIEEGPNVDIVMPINSKQDWRFGSQFTNPLARAIAGYPNLTMRFDVLISGQCLEHVEQPWVWIRQLESITKPGGLVWITAPNTWCYHEYPKDCWRVWPDGLKALFDWAGLETIETYITGPEKYDTVGLARKPL